MRIAVTPYIWSAQDLARPAGNMATNGNLIVELVRKLRDSGAAVRPAIFRVS